MSSAVFSTSAAQGRPFGFDDQYIASARPQPSGAELFGEARPPQRVIPVNLNQALLSGKFKDARLAHIAPASRLEVRPAPEMASSGIAAMDALTGGLPRGCLTEICGPPSSGRTTLLLSALSAATRRGEYCALVDASDALDPQSAFAARVELRRLLWVRCGENSHNPEPRYAEKRLEHLLRVADLLLESGGFGLIALDLGDLPPQTARRTPLTTWFRFRRAVEHTPTVLLAIERQSIAGSCSSLLIKLGPAGNQQLWKSAAQMNGLLDSELTAEACPERVGERRENAAHGASRESEIRNNEAEERKNIYGDKQSTGSQFPEPTHAQLLTEMEITAKLVRSKLDRKPVRSAEIAFASKTAWAG